MQGVSVNPEDHDWAADNVGAGGDDDDATLPAKAEPVRGASGWLYGFVQGRNAAGEWYESVLFYLVFATVVQQSLETLPAWKAAYGQELDMLEEVSVAIFAFDYLARLATAQGVGNSLTKQWIIARHAHKNIRGGTKALNHSFIETGAGKL